MRSLVFASAAALALCGFAAPAQATTSQVSYGYAWADGSGSLRVVPMTAKLTKRDGYLFYKLKRVPGARELKLDYRGAAYTRVTLACDLKETEGRIAVDRKGLGKTACKPKDLAATLARGPQAVRVEHSGGKALRVSEFFPAGESKAVTARGTLKWVNGNTLLFTANGRTTKLGYTWLTAFSRVTAKCGAGWLTGRPVNADRNGLGKKECTGHDLTKVMKKLKYPVLVKVDYLPDSRYVNQVWEIYGDA
ncbi:hypothetical protein HII36_41000 [Nonomuraea sp. NN258]|uniref:hypothetical protein n=1 Tax=Nonomuraea antri TaxID=2730852 RepID=UPI001568CB39|nr:hypothetical protein [Nonomuraea antri]NRQ38164.1 hypothetical protein [Nonomuraea antri]